MTKLDFYSSKTYTHATGHSCAFRQWRSTHSHCRLIHGYSLQFQFTFGSSMLDERNWVVDFGGLSELKAWLNHMFDHTLVIAEDDPHRDKLAALADHDLADIRILPSVGCERFAEMCFHKAQEIIQSKYGDRCWVQEVTVREHESNSATVRRSAE
jgi:6-pyruvoyltetrahydropterin/6-carboxytetrahydropterin synthase